MPKQPHKMVLGVLDESAYTIMGVLRNSSMKSFSELLSLTRLPKSSLYVTLIKMVDNNLIIRNGAFFKLSDDGVLVYRTFYSIINRTEEPLIEAKEEVQESTLSRLFKGIKKILGK
ncbi:MAG: hypothetical protein QXJ17_07610 [Nitrososphaeria archaeon]